MRRIEDSPIALSIVLSREYTRRPISTMTVADCRGFVFSAMAQTMTNPVGENPITVSVGDCPTLAIVF